MTAYPKINVEYNERIQNTLKNLKDAAQDILPFFRGKQGCILSPLLFNLVIEKVARSVTARSKWGTFDNVRVNCLGYADDIDIIVVNLREVENLTTQFKIMVCQVGLEINQGKTKIMDVVRTPQLQENVDLAGIRIETVESFKYRGTIMSQNA
ncbi:uncharacterized protein [Palaemon carinicauda]|uniref:uncharacterized protein n=1 Tax=Palaemon carinicauda TaxID=392227 RepID=UPI0035B594BF